MVWRIGTKTSSNRFPIVISQVMRLTERQEKMRSLAERVFYISLPVACMVIVFFFQIE